MCSLNTLLAKQFVEGTFREGEQPTARRCNYERLAERNSQTHEVQKDRWAVWGGSLNNKLTTYLLRVQEAAIKESEI
jgi:hypothetical protein